ncbi:MAG TPA: tol-pal system protein YbgF [Alphaproteobacteria bacterium]
MALLAGPALAQNSDTRELMNRIDRLQRELSTLQQDYYRNRGAPSGAAVGATAGSATAASFEVRLSQIESQLQALTGRAEELSHATDLIKDRLDKLVSDVDGRLMALEQQRGGSAQAAPPQQQQQSSAPPPAPRGQPPGQPAQPGRGTPPANLGTLPQDAASIKPPLPDGNAKQQYDYATALITKDQNFPEAERSLKAFIAAYPTDTLTPNAYYWLGETYYVRKDYQQAAFTFAEAFQKYPKAQKAPDSLFKLGLSLSQLNQTKEACTAYGRLLDNFPTADNALKARVSNEQRRLKCV